MNFVETAGVRPAFSGRDSVALLWVIQVISFPFPSLVFGDNIKLVPPGFKGGNSGKPF
jgi:hypothetical protein